jgi:hypothetical protein
VSKPEDPEGQESVWARLEREDREDAKQHFRPLMLIRTAVLWPVLPVLAGAFGRPLPLAALVVVFSFAFGQLTAGWLLYRSNRRAT